MEDQKRNAAIVLWQLGVELFGRKMLDRAKSGSTCNSTWRDQEGTSVEGRQDKNCEEGENEGRI